jgi:PKD repeat protein
MTKATSPGWPALVIPGSPRLLPATVLAASMALASCGAFDDNKSKSNNRSNTPPVLAASASSLTEDSVSTSSVVATFSATDEDNDELTFSLVDNTDGYFTISGSNVLLTEAGVAAINDDALALTSLLVKVRVSDGTDADQNELTIPVTRVNDAPVLTVEASDLTEGEVNSSTVVATFTAIDPEGADLEYSVSGVNQAYFTISNNRILLSDTGVAAINNDTLNLTSLSATVILSDGVNSVEKSFSIVINRVDNAEEARYIKLFEDDFESGSVSKWTSVNLTGGNDWHVETYAGDQFAVANCYASPAACDTWIVTPELNILDFDSVTMTFNTAWNYGTGTDQMQLLVSTDFDGSDPATANWTDISDRVTWSDGNFTFTDSGEVSLSNFAGQPVYVAFHYAYTVANATKWEVDDILIDGMGRGEFPLQAEITIPDGTFFVSRDITFNGSAVNGAGEPFTYAWDFGDGQTSTEAKPVHAFAQSGRYTVDFTVTDADANTVTTTIYVEVEPQTTFSVAARQGDFRIATFNAGFDLQTAAGEQHAAFDGGNYRKAQKVAEIIQRAHPDILLLNEIDGNDNGATVTTFNTQYLAVAQADDVEGITYDYVYYGDNGNANYCNTGAPIEESVEVDFNGDGDSADPEDRYGFGNYNGQYCMAIFSRFPIDSAALTRTFQAFKWQDMPDHLVPPAVDASGNVTSGTWYSDEEMSIFRLSSKTHIDLPVNVNGTTVHVLASHPTPPVFDGNEDRNGMRNFDEIRLWADYINPASNYLYDDQGNTTVSLASDDRFVILGDQNASTYEGDAYTKDGVTAIEQLLLSPYVNPNLHEDSTTLQIPTSVAGTENAPGSVYASTHTAGWKQRADYVLPSAYGLKVSQSGILWPRHSDNLHYLVEAVDADDIESSDHRLVWVDMEIFDGTTAVEEETGSNPELVNETFDNLNAFTVIDNGESAQNWSKSAYNGTNYAKISCYNADETCDDWLILPLDLSSAGDVIMNFQSAYKYGSDPLAQIQLLVSTNFSGDVTSANWTDLSAAATWSSGNFVFADSGDVNLSAYSGQTVYVAFHYNSISGSAAATWEIANLVITNKGSKQEVTQTEETFNNLDNVNVIDRGEDAQNWLSSSYNGTGFAKISCYNADEPCDDWMIRSVDLSKGSDHVLNFDSAYKYGTNPLDQIRLLVSTDFDGVDVTTATWVDLTAEAAWSAGNFVFVNSGDIDLSAYSGRSLFIAFHYTSTSGSDAATWEIANLLIKAQDYVVSEEEPVDTLGGTVLADTAPAYTALNAVNQRATGTLEFAEVAAPASATDEIAVIASTGISINGTAIADSGFKTLIKAGDQIDGNVYGQIKDQMGTDLFVSNLHEFGSIFPVGDRVFGVSQFESIPGGMHLVEYSQDSTTGTLTPVSTQLLDFSAIHGGYNHCAAMVTPWNTHLGSEEYEPNAKARSAATGQIDSYYDPIATYLSGDSLLDINPYWYGYPVEVVVHVDGSNVTSTATKHYALGRVSNEIAYVMPDRKTVYRTDDGSNGGGLYMFVADTAEDLSAGNLYAMKWNQTDAGSDDNAHMGAADIEWIALGHATNTEVAAMINGDHALTFSDLFEAVEPVNGNCPLGYHSINYLGTQECLQLKSGMEQAASRLETRRYAALKGATVEMVKEEGFTYNLHNHKAYMAISNLAKGMLNANSLDVGGQNHVQLSTENGCGGVYELSLGSNSRIGSEFVVGSVKGLIAGVEQGNACDIEQIAGPDNVAYVGYNTLIISEDTSDHANNFTWAYDLDTRVLTRIFSAPLGAENTGPYMFNNVNGFSYITNVVQHPGGEETDPSSGNEARMGYFGPIPVAAASTAMSVTEALAVTEDQLVIEVVGVITTTVINGDYALEIADVNDPSQLIVVKLNGDDRTLWGPVTNPAAAGTTITVTGERDLEGYSGRQSIEGATQITAR